MIVIATLTLAVGATAAVGSLLNAVVLRRLAVSVSRAHALFPAGDVIGQYIHVAGPERRDVEVIGVVADAPYGKLDDPRPFVFRPILQEAARTQFPIACVRASGDLATVRDGYTRVVKSLGHRSLRSFITSLEWVDHPLLQERFTAGLATFAAALTILVSCIGVYALLAYSVTTRVREIGVRLALGAERRTVVWMIVRDGLAIAVPGVLIGAPCAWAAARLVRAQLYGIAPGDPRTLLIAAAMFPSLTHPRCIAGWKLAFQPTWDGDRSSLEWRRFVARDVDVLSERNDVEDGVDGHECDAMVAIDNGPDDVDALMMRATSSSPPKRGRAAIGVRRKLAHGIRMKGESGGVVVRIASMYCSTTCITCSRSLRLPQRRRICLVWKSTDRRPAGCHVTAGPASFARETVTQSLRCARDDLARSRAACRR